MMAFMEERRDAARADGDQSRARLEGILDAGQLETWDDMVLERRAFARGRASVQRGSRSAMRGNRSFRGARSDMRSGRAGMRGGRAFRGEGRRGPDDRGFRRGPGTRGPGGDDAPGEPGSVPDGIRWATAKSMSVRTALSGRRTKATSWAAPARCRARSRICKRALV